MLRPYEVGCTMSETQPHTPIRTCLGCGAKTSPLTMLRIASKDGGAPVVDEPRAKRKAPGRGAYLCANVKCLERAVGKRALERSLKLKCGLSSAAKAEIARAIELTRTEQKTN